MERLENMADGMNHPEGTENESKLYRRHFALKGVENHRLFEIVEESPAITKADAEKKAGRNRGALKQNFEDLIASDVIREIDGSLYMGLEAIAASHGRDRGPDDIVHGDYSKYLDSQTEFREQQQWHDRTLVRVQSRLEDMGIYSVQGRRLNIGYKTSKEEMGVNSTTLKPDLWVAVPTDDGDRSGMLWNWTGPFIAYPPGSKSGAHCLQQISITIRSHISSSQTGTPEEIGAPGNALMPCG